MESAFLARQVGLVNAGDADALHVLIVHYHPVLLRKVAAGFDGALKRRLDPEDVLQEAYVKAFQGIGACDFRQPAGFYKWLETIALNELKNQKRSHHQQKRDAGRKAHGGGGGSAAGQPNSFPDFLQRVSAGDPTPSRLLGEAELRAALIAGLARLSPDQRAVLRLRFWGNRRAAEIAAKLGKSEEAVYALCYRGLKALAAMLGSITRFISRG